MASQKFNFLLRARDILVALFGLIFLSPLFLFIAIRIKRDSPGPVFFKGPRVGKDGQLFHILKFRTMLETSDSYNGPKITGEDDPRITPIGNWLRETKLNELPQLWNLLIGEMSLVGPRPEDPDFVEDWPTELRDEILSIRPGITSPASVLFRDEESMLTQGSLMETYLGSIQPSKLRLDQLYVRYRSIWVDIDVLFWTLLILFPGLSKSKPPERMLFGGLFSRGAQYITSWFFIDFFVSLIAVSLTALFWRAVGPIHVGLWAGVSKAIEFAVIFTAIGAIFGVQKIHWSKASPADVLELLVSSMVATLVLLVTNMFRSRLPAMLIVSGAITAFFGLVIVRYRYRVFTGFASRWLKFRKGGDIYRERILIIGSGDAGSYAAWMLSNSREAINFRVIGYLDDDFQKQGIRYRGAEVLGSTEDIEKITHEYDVGIILFAIHNIEDEQREKILKRCESTQAQVVIFPNILGHLSDALSSDGHSSREKAREMRIENLGEKVNHSTSVAPKEKMQMILNDLKSNLDRMEINKCRENIASLDELINQNSEEDHSGK